jgi:tRNA 2-thiouridine synthesizing protein B
LLHIIKKSPYESSAFNDAAGYISHNDDIVLLTEDGIYAAKKGGKFEGQLRSLMQKNVVYCLLADIKARGIQENEIIENVKVIDYKGFVEKVVEHNPMTWA